MTYLSMHIILRFCNKILCKKALKDQVDIHMVNLIGILVLYFKIP